MEGYGKSHLFQQFIDVIFLKTKYKGCLLAATGKNANQDLYPIAYAIVDAENGDNWLCFVKCFRDAIGDSRDINFKSDRHLGLLEALPQMFSNFANFYCNRHLKDSLKGRFNGKTYKGLKERIVTLFEKCAYASEPAFSSQYLAEFLSEGGRIAQNFLDDLPYMNWTNAYYDGCRYYEMTTNAIESFNSWIRDPRELPITQCIDILRQKLMEWFVQRKKEAAKWNGYLCPVMEDRYKQLIEEARTWQVKSANSHIYEVFPVKTYTVHFRNQTYTCCDWQLKGFPCSRAIAAARKFGLSMEDYIQSYWFVDSYRASYEKPILPIPTSVRKGYEFADDQKIKPPLIKRPPGRPKHRRFKTKGEREDVKLIRCSRYKKLGHHNRKRCTVPISD